MLKPRTMAAVMQEDGVAQWPAHDSRPRLDDPRTGGHRRATGGTSATGRGVPRIGRRVVYRRSEVDRWLAELAQASA